MGGNSVNFCRFLNVCMLGMLETTFHGQKTFCLVGGSLSWSETPYFHKGGPLRMEPKLPLSDEKKGKNFFFQTAISRELRD